MIIKNILNYYKLIIKEKNKFLLANKVEPLTCSFSDTINKSFLNTFN